MKTPKDQFNNCYSALRAAWLLAVLAALTLAPNTAPAQYLYVVTNGSVTITEYQGLSLSLDIPETIDGLPVTRIDDLAFLGTYITNLTIPKWVTSVGIGAFAFSKLATITLNENLRTIEGWAFQGCLDLRSIRIPDSVTEILDCAFESCANLESITLGANLDFIGQETFYWCLNLKSIALRANVASIGDKAFAACFSMNSLEVDPMNNVFSSVDGVLFTKDQTALSIYPPGRKGIYTVPESVASIGSLAFFYCTNLASVVVGKNVTEIDDIAFASSGITNVVLPESLLRIGKYAFGHCDSLAGATIPPGVTAIEESAFRECPNLINVTIQDSPTSIGADAFYKCTRLETAMLGKRITSLGWGAFYDCDALKEIQVSGTLREIEPWTFCRCTALEIVNIGHSVTSIGNSAFYGCVSLSKLSLSNNIDHIGEDAIWGCTGLIQFTVPPKVTNIEPDTFHYCTNLASISLPEGLTNIASSAFQYCTRLRNVVIPNKVETIGPYAFAQCESLETVTVGSGVKEIGYCAFYCAIYGWCSLKELYFRGDAPVVRVSHIFSWKPTIYYLPGTSGWSSTYAGCPTAPWALPYPVILDGSYRMEGGSFRFIISWPGHSSVVVEASPTQGTNSWSVLAEVPLLDGQVTFADPVRTPNRCYRVRAPK